MGYGAHMTVVNKSTKGVTTYVNDQNCMYDNGTEGSWLSKFNNLALAPFKSFPESGKGMYIETKASGMCAFENSSFSLKISGLTKDSSMLNFSDVSRSWKCSGQPGHINVNINNSDNQAMITITLSDPAL
jgi:hypothetical protein